MFGQDFRKLNNNKPNDNYNNSKTENNVAENFPNSNLIIKEICSAWPFVDQTTKFTSSERSRIRDQSELNRTNYRQFAYVPLENLIKTDLTCFDSKSLPNSLYLSQTTDSVNNTSSQERKLLKKQYSELNNSNTKQFDSQLKKQKPMSKFNKLHNKTGISYYIYNF